MCIRCLLAWQAAIDVPYSLSLACQCNTADLTYSRDLRERCTHVSVQLLRFRIIYRC